MTLQHVVTEAAARNPSALAVEGPDGSMTYGHLDRLADQYAAALRRRGVRAGQRVVLWAEKSAQLVAIMQGCLRIEAVYVPLASANPPSRLERISAGCQPALIVTDEEGELLAAEAHWSGPPLVTVDRLLREAEAISDARLPPPTASLDDVAYVLYTSGSTGEPKGVSLTHRNALAFVRWAAGEVGLSSADRLANHAPFNFDLSVFDLYAAFLVGASVHLVQQELAYAPEQLVGFLVDRRISVWYSVPSALILMMTKGRLLHRDIPAALRACIFAGEPFPLAHLSRLRAAWPTVRMWNWYGPTETNVCTSFEVLDGDLEHRAALPIGSASSGACLTLAPAEEGAAGQELLVAGPTVMAGYWGQPEHTGPYHTGDLVRCGDDGNLEYVGRRDQMVKLRGHRVELGEVEAALSAHPSVDDVGVVVVGTGLEAALHALIVPSADHPPSLMELKKWSAERLPGYMFIDALHPVQDIPRTANGKKDRREMAAQLKAGTS